MYDSRKTLLNVLLDNLINVFNILSVILLIILILNKDYLYIIPLCLSLCASIFSLVLDFKHFIIPARIHQRVNVLVDGVEHEKSFSSLKVGKEVVLYPNEKINFVGTIKSGFLYVDESSINGTTQLVKKTVGSSVVKGSVVVEGSGVVEIKELDKRFAKITFVKETKLKKRIRLFNLIFSSLSALIILLVFILDKDNLDRTAKCAIAATPYLLNIILVVFLFVLSKNGDKNIKIFDYTFLDELQDVDVVCLDKTGTLTTGQYEIFKTVILSQSAFSTISLDANRAFELTVANIIKTTKEKENYYSVLQDRFDYEVSKIIDASSSLSQNGLYSAITVRGGSTFALGEVDNFELANVEGTMPTIKEYQSMGCRVLVLVESKNPLKSGLIDGKPTAVGLIILQETIRESVKDLIEYCLKNNKQIKVISGDKIAPTSEICRKAGLENLGKATSVKLVPFEKIALLVEEDIVFADATPSHKAFIVKELQKDGHKVAYIGDGDNDTQALKAANVAISLSSGSTSAIKCSHACVNESFNLTNTLIKKSQLIKTKIDSLMAITYSQAAFVSFYLLVFMIASLINKNISNPFEYSHLWLWTVLGVIVPIIIILVNQEERKKTICFFRSFVASSILLIVPIGVMFILQLLQLNGVGYFALPSDINDVHETLITSHVVYNLSYLSLIVMSFFIAYYHLSPLNKIRGIAFAITFVIPVVYIVLLVFDIHALSIVTQINTDIINPVNYFVMGIITISISSLYLFVLDVISTLKGENPDVKNKSKN